MPTRAIVIDDDHDTVEVFSEYLALNDIEVLGRGHNGDDAIKLFKEIRPDVVFLDVLMPDSDGIYALEKIRELDSKAKIIVVTASITSVTQQRLLELDVSAIVWKPYDMDKLLKVLESVKTGETGISPRRNG